MMASKDLLVFKALDKVAFRIRYGLFSIVGAVLFIYLKHNDYSILKESKSSEGKTNRWSHATNIGTSIGAQGPEDDVMHSSDDVMHSSTLKAT